MILLRDVTILQTFVPLTLLKKDVFISELFLCFGNFDRMLDKNNEIWNKLYSKKSKDQWVKNRKYLWNYSSYHENKSYTFLFCNIDNSKWKIFRLQCNLYRCRLWRRHIRAQISFSGNLFEMNTARYRTYIYHKTRCKWVFLSFFFSWNGKIWLRISARDTCVFKCNNPRCRVKVF